MEFFDVIRARRSVRQYTEEKVPESVIERALDSALIAPNSSNLQPWEFYWVRTSEKKAALVKACFSQSAARTAGELVVAVSRTDTWKRHRDEVLKQMGTAGSLPRGVESYYRKLIPALYTQDPLGILGIIRRIGFAIAGLFRIVPRGPTGCASLFEVVTKTTALACENFMLAVVAQGYGCCPMEGFDERRVKRLLDLGCSSHVVMVISVGRSHPSGIWGEQLRVPRDWVVHQI